MPPYKKRRVSKGKGSFKKKSSSVTKFKIKNKSTFDTMFMNYLSNTAKSWKLNCPMPDAFRTILTCDWTAYEGAASGATNEYQVWASQCLLPFSTSALSIGPTSCLNPTGTAVDSGSTSTGTRNCQGLSRLFNKGQGQTIYKQVHVLNAYISVCYMPQISGDTVKLIVGPQRDSDSAPIGNIQSDMLPHWKGGDCQTLTPRKDCTVHNKLNIPQYMGMTESAYLSNPLMATGINANAGTYIYPATTATGGGQVFWTIRRACIDGSSNGNVIPYDIKVKYDVLFSELTAEDIPST